ncbi:MAG: hypothetical protein WD048_00310 [Chitinophagales bacterium]
MKKVVLFCFAALLFVPDSNQLLAQSETKVATVRLVNWMGAPKRKSDEQRLIISKPGEDVIIRELQQRYIDGGMNEQIDSDNRIINEEFAKLYNEGYELETSTSSNFSVQQSGSMMKGGTPEGGREIIYIFVKE